MLSEEQKKLLNADLPADAVKKRKGGSNKDLSFVEGWWVIDRLNAILGPAGWSYDCTLTETHRELGKNDKNDPQWQVSHLAKCVLKVGDCTIGDYGAGNGNERSLAGALEKSAKEACTDALKRCAKSLGRSLGLALYDKEQEHVGGAEVPGPTEAGQRLIDEARAAQNGERQKVWARCRAAWSTLNAFDKDTLNAIAQQWTAEKKGGAA